MCDPLRTFLRTCPQIPNASCPVFHFTRAFRATLSPAECAAWPRTRLVAAMSRAGYGLAFDAQNRAHFTGLILPLQVTDRRLTVAVA